MPFESVGRQTRPLTARGMKGQTLRQLSPREYGRNALRPY